MTRQDVRPADRVGIDAPSDTAVAVDRLVTAGLKALADYGLGEHRYSGWR
ncbi:hypothetical protein ACIQHU_06445 [Streptomyces tendae]